MTTRTIFAALILTCLALNALHAQRKPALSVSKDQTFRFDVAISTTSTMNFTSTVKPVADRSGKPVTTKLAARFVLSPNEIRRNEVVWANGIFNPTYDIIGIENPLKNMPFTAGARNFAVSSDGVVATNPVYTAPWGILAAATLEQLGINERHFNQFFFLQSALAQHKRGDTWERRHDDTVITGLLHTRQHYTVRFTHDGIVDTLKTKTMRVRFEFTIDSIANDLNARNTPQGKHFAPEVHDFIADSSNEPKVESETHNVVHGTVHGVAYYSVRDGMIVAFNSAHTMTLQESTANVIRMNGDGGNGTEMKSAGGGGLNGTISIVRR